MKTALLLTFFLRIGCIFCQTDSVKIFGKLMDAQTHQSIPDFEVFLSNNFGVQIQHAKTNDAGEFQFVESKQQFIHLIFSDSGYIEKSIFSRDTSSEVHLVVTLRDRKTAFTFQEIDSTVLGSKIKHVLKSYDLEMTDIDQIDEPPGISRGFKFELGDSTVVFLFTKRVRSLIFFKPKWMKQKIIGVGIARIDGTVNEYGVGRPLILAIENKYLLDYSK